MQVVVAMDEYYEEVVHVAGCPETKCDSPDQVVPFEARTRLQVAQVIIADAEMVGELDPYRVRDGLNFHGCCSSLR